MNEQVTSAQLTYVAKQNRRRRMVAAARVFVLIIFLSIWELSARIGVLNDFIFSSPSKIMSCMVVMIRDGSMVYHTGITVLETMVSFILVIVLGIGGAILLWSSRTLSEILDPYLVILNSLPKSALAPILIVWLGANVRTIIVAAVSVAVFGSILTLHNGFSNMDRDQIKLIASLGGSKKDVMTKVLLPGSVPMIVSNMKVNVGLCLVGVIIGEFLAAKAGLGYLIIYGSQTFQLTLVVTSILILCILSALMYRGIAWIEKRLEK
ncbi:MAG: ABC transporter permease [Lachnospiraceae bacterium]|nr:ABC transporter permease [Lachnospiraceae bacterium]